MMICRADFEELFPSQFQDQNGADAPDGSEMPAPAHAGALAAAIPAALAY
ncbi:MAG: hypothetical protein K8F59_13050 [Rhodobacteraceae bacterium]|nr:hypothetical protein [Paracoccaceae bacterium]